MSKIFIEESTLSAIGDSIRAKTGKSDLIGPLDMPSEISSIQGGGAAVIKTVSGVCPITLEDCAKGSLLDYKIYGADGVVGNKTKNLCSGVFNLQFVKLDEPIPAGTKFSVSAGTRGYDASDTSKRLRVRFFAADGTQIANMYPTLDDSGNRLRFDGLSYSNDVDSYWFSVLDVGDYQIEIGEKHTEYEPYGYSVDIKVNDNSPKKVYIGNAKLSADDYIDFENRTSVIGGVPTSMELPEIPLMYGSNTFDVDSAVKPSNVELSYVSKTGAYEAGYTAGYDEMKLAVDMSDVTYRFNEEVTTYPSNWYRINLNFTDANGTKYTQMSPYTSSSRINVQYVKAAGGTVNAFNAVNTPMWADEAYRTIHIVDGTMTGDIETFRWLFNNGTFNPTD